MHRILVSMSKASLVKPKRTLLLAIFIFVVSLSLIPRIQLSTSNLDLLDPETPEVKQFLHFGRTFGSMNSLFIGIRGSDPQLLKDSVDRLLPELEQLPDVRQVLGKLPFSDEVLDVMGLEPYFLSYDHQLAVIMIQPDDLETRVEKAVSLIDRVRESLSRDGVLPEGVQYDLTGIPVYAADDQRVIKGDIQRYSILGLIFVGLIFLLGFRSLWTPLLAVGWLCVAVTMTAGMITFIPGRLTLLSASFASLLFGLGIDFGIHITHRFEESLLLGYSRHDAALRAVQETAPGLITGAMTTSCVFFSLVFTGFLGFRELGIIGGIGILVSLVILMTAFPASLVLLPQLPQRNSKIEHKPQPKWLRISGTSIILLSCSFFIFGFPKFDSNYMNLQPADSAAANLEKALFSGFDQSTQFAAFIAKDAVEAEALTQQLQVLPEVKHISSYRDYELLEEDGLDLSMPDSLKRGLISYDGSYAVLVYPQGNIWEMDIQSKFVKQMRSIQDNVTGMPILGHLMLNETKHALMVSGSISLVMVFLVTIMGFRSIRWTMLALIPTIATVFALPGLMVLLNLSFNPINVMAIPVVLGIAVDDGVHFLHRFRATGGSSSLAWQQTARSILLTSLTNLVAFGSLILTSHRGLQSFIVLLCLGITYALVVSLSILPMISRFFMEKGWLNHPSSEVEHQPES